MGHCYCKKKLEVNMVLSFPIKVYACGLRALSSQFPQCYATLHYLYFVECLGMGVHKRYLKVALFVKRVNTVTCKYFSFQESTGHFPVTSVIHDVAVLLMCPGPWL